MTWLRHFHSSSQHLLRLFTKNSCTRSHLGTLKCATFSVRLYFEVSWLAVPCSSLTAHTDCCSVCRESAGEPDQLLYVLSRSALFLKPQFCQCAPHTNTANPAPLLHRVDLSAHLQTWGSDVIAPGPGHMKGQRSADARDVRERTDRGEGFRRNTLNSSSGCCSLHRISDEPSCL